MLTAQYFKVMRELFDKFEPSRERSLALKKLRESERWLSKCIPIDRETDQETEELPTPNP